MTKSFQIFDGKIRSLKQHLQLIDLSLTLACKCCNKEKDNGKNIATTLHAVSGTHLQLNIPNKTTDIKRTFAYSRRKLNEQAIIELYRLFSDYISNIVSELFKNNPYQLFGAITDKNERALFYHEIIQLSSYDAIIEEISKRIYRSFEKQRSTPKLLEKIISTTKVSISNEIKQDALLYLEIRYLIIHNNSNVDEKFKRMDKVLANCAILSIIVSVVIGGGSYLLGHQILGIYTKQEDVIQCGMEILSISTIPYFLCGLMDMIPGSMRGVGYSAVPMILSIIGTVGTRLVWIYGVFPEHRSLYVLFMSYPVSWGLTIVMQAICLVFVRRKIRK